MESLKATEPALDAGETLAVSVTGAPSATGFGSAVSVVWVALSPNKMERFEFDEESIISPAA